MQQSYRRAAQWYLKANRDDELDWAMRSHPLQCAPFGEWRPELSPLVPLEILKAMRTTMLLCKRMRVPHGVARIVVEYVCTEGEEWAELLRNERLE